MLYLKMYLLEYVDTIIQHISNFAKIQYIILIYPVPVCGYNTQCQRFLKNKIFRLFSKIDLKIFINRPFQYLHTIWHKKHTGNKSQEYHMGLKFKKIAGNQMLLATDYSSSRQTSRSKESPSKDMLIRTVLCKT